MKNRIEYRSQIIDIEVTNQEYLPNTVSISVHCDFTESHYMDVCAYSWAKNMIDELLERTMKLIDSCLITYEELVEVLKNDGFTE